MGIKEMDAFEASRRFKVNGKVMACERYGTGHINHTYKVVTSTDAWYILQKVNTFVFRDYKNLMRNIVNVTKHLAKKAKNQREVLTLIDTVDGQDYLITEDHEVWRLYDFVKDSVCYDQATTPEIFAASATAFGQFQNLLADFPAEDLAETIPNFHHTVRRYEALDRAIEYNYQNRIETVRPEIEFALSIRPFASTLIDLLEAGKLPLRVTHNDTKLNNVLFDKVTNAGVCVIDLDTVMPGLVVNDFGDSIRFGAVRASENEKDLSKIFLDRTYYEAYTNTFIDTTRSKLTDLEIRMLPVGAKMMTLESGIRFLTDYLNGDTYFQTHYPDQNLDRCRTQFKYVRDMDANWDFMNEVVEKAKGKS